MRTNATQGHKPLDNAPKLDHIEVYDGAELSIYHADHAVDGQWLQTTHWLDAEGMR